MRVIIGAAGFGADHGSHRAVRHMVNRKPVASVVVAMRLVRIFDEVDAQHGPSMAPDHPVVAVAEAARWSAYLRGGAVVLASTATMDDVVDTARRDAVPMGFRTDGAWIWSDAVTYYVEQHGLAPDGEFADDVRRRGFASGPVSETAVREALTVLMRPVPDAVWTKPS